jgi:hypothetical protein
MEPLIRHRQAIVSGLLPLLVCFFIQVNGYAGAPQTGDMPVQNVRWMQKGDVIIINYDLVGAPEAEYDVSIVVRQKNDTTFALVPSSILGDVGVRQRAGINKGIRWQYRLDLPQRPSAASYYFEIKARMLSKPGNSLYYVIGGSALAAAGLLVLLAGGHQNAQAPGVAELPLPPGRP